ncbi:MAG: radical SAM protein, partial [Hyphomicrobiaceae bacterium]|nr:radical SAM protein [Hyphomicrobiaceae bacterium]
MSELRPPQAPHPLAKFEHPDWTAAGEPRASVALIRLETLWINTGTLCNITCRNCYIESSPSNDRIAYISRDEARAFYDEIATAGLGTPEIGFTGGEPFLNPQILGLIEDALARGFQVLVLTNAMQPIQRPRIKSGLLDLNRRFPGRLTLRVSLDHYGETLHETERGEMTWAKAVAGLDWLIANGFKVAIAARTCWGQSEADARAGYAGLIAKRGWPINAADPAQLVLLPEMDGRRDVPEITT